MKKTILAFAILAVSAAQVGAQQLTPSCQADLDKHALAREAEIKRTNELSKKRTTATNFCAQIRKLTNVETAMLKWMTDNQDWCRLPDPLVTQFKDAVAQTDKAKANVCSAAAKEQKMMREGAAQQRGGPAVGGGVQLPKGAL